MKRYQVPLFFFWPFLNLDLTKIHLFFNSQTESEGRHHSPNSLKSKIYSCQFLFRYLKIDWKLYFLPIVTVYLEKDMFYYRSRHIPAFIEHLPCKVLFMHHSINSQSAPRSVLIISILWIEEAGVSNSVVTMSGTAPVLNRRVTLSPYLTKKRFTCKPAKN